MLDKQNQAIVGKVVLLVIFLALLPTIISSIVTAQATSGIDTSASSMLDIFQMLVVVGGIGGDEPSTQPLCDRRTPGTKLSDLV